MLSLSRRNLLTIGAAAVLPPSRAPAAKPVVIAAATDLQQVLPDLIAAFGTDAPQHSIVATYGATGNIARQIRQGAPFELFLAADERFIEDLVADGIVPDRGAVYAQGQLALAAFHQGPFAETVSLDAIASAARAGIAFRLAIANPEHAPYGQRALEVLERTGLRALLQPRLVYGESVAQALQFIATGAVAAGLVSHSLAQVPALSARLRSTAISGSLHTPLIQRMALTRKATEPARAFFVFLTTPAARRIFSAHHFELT